MANTKRTLAYLHIEDTYNNFFKDIKIPIPIGLYDLKAEEILSNISKKVLGKYIDRVREDTCTLTLMIPRVVNKEELLEAWDDQDIKQVNTDIETILSKLSLKQREQVLNHLNSLKK